MDSTAKRIRRKRRRICIAVSATLLALALALALALLLLILGLTVFRARHAVITVNSVHLTSLRAGIDVPILSVDLNVTLDLDLTVTNPNKASFKYGNGSGELYYRGGLAGEVAIPPGKISAGGTIRTDITLTLLAGKLISNSAVYSDVVSGMVPFTTYTTIPGRVTVLGVFKHHMVSYTTCDVVVNVRNRTVENSDCRYKTKL